MTIVILFKNGKEISVKCNEAEFDRDKETGRIVNIHFVGIKDNQLLDLDFNEVIAIYRKVSDEV